MSACLDCSMRGACTTVRDHGMGGVDISLGLEDRGDGVFACRACGQRYQRTETLAEAPYLDRDYDLYDFQKLEPVLPGAPPVLPPRSTRPPQPRAEEPRPAPPRQAPPTPQPVFAEPQKRVSPGCTNCGGQDAMAAWASLHARHVASPVREPHFEIELKRCTCGQAWVVVFTERVDFRDGDDVQTWLAVPVTPDEAKVLSTCEPSRVPGGVAELGRDRRFLMRSTFSHQIAWRESGFAIPPHD